MVYVKLRILVVSYQSCNACWPGFWEILLLSKNSIWPSADCTVTYFVLRETWMFIKKGVETWIPMGREHVVVISRWEKNVEISPTDKGDREFQLPPGNHELAYQMHFIILLQYRCETMEITMHLVNLLGPKCWKGKKKKRSFGHFCIP